MWPGYWTANSGMEGQSDEHKDSQGKEIKGRDKFCRTAATIGLDAFQVPNSHRWPKMQRDFYAEMCRIEPRRTGTERGLNHKSRFDPLNISKRSTLNGQRFLKQVRKMDNLNGVKDAAVAFCRRSLLIQWIIPWLNASKLQNWRGTPMRWKLSLGMSYRNWNLKGEILKKKMKPQSS